jgi:hypothetical protein
MKQNVSPGVIAVIAVVLVAIIGFAAYKTFGPKASQSTELNAKQSAMRDSQIKAMSGPQNDAKNRTKDNPPTSGGTQ